MVVKAQVHAGGRGGGRSGLLGETRRREVLHQQGEVRAVAGAMLQHSLKTKQTGPDGTKIQTLIVQADAEPAKVYLGMVLDRAPGRAGADGQRPRAAWTSRKSRPNTPRRSSKCRSRRNRAFFRPGPASRLRTRLHRRPGRQGRGDHDGGTFAFTSTRTPRSPRLTRWRLPRRATWSSSTPSSTSTTTALPAQGDRRPPRPERGKPGGSPRPPRPTSTSSRLDGTIGCLVNGAGAGDGDDGHHQVPRQQPGELPRRRRQRQFRGPSRRSGSSFRTRR